LANGARLTEIYRDSVVLERAGESVRLYVAAASDAGNPSLARNTPSNPLSMVGAMGAVAPSDEPPEARLTDYLRPSPVFGEDRTDAAGSAVHGYALYPGRNAEVFSQWNLKAGDVLTHINGNSISDASAALASLDTLLEGAALTVQIQREGT